VVEDVAAAPGARAIGVGMVGYAFMGEAHSQAWRTVARVFDHSVVPRMVAIGGRSRDQVARAAKRLGWEGYETDWRVLVNRDDVDLVDVCTPGHSHAEISIAALEAGKHVLCEKPLANTIAEAEAMVDAAEHARANGVLAMVGFNYRRVPAITLARQFVAAGRLGTIRHVRAVYLQDWIVDPEFPLVWRLQADQAGSGALGDLGAHIVDLAQYLIGSRISRVSALTETFVTERPLVAPAAAQGLSGASGAGGPAAERGQVTVDDAALFLARFGNGAVGSFEATRFATGRKNGLRLEINGDLGSLVFDLEALNELHFYDGAEPAAEQGFRRILVTEPEHPYMAAWWPPGHLIGYEHTFTNQLHDLLTAIEQGTDPAPSFADGLQVQRVLDAVGRSAAGGAGWVEIPAQAQRSAEEDQQ
jgi:predicted dehydrogenase